MTTNHTPPMTEPCSLKPVWSAVDNGRQVFVRDESTGETVCIVSFAPNRAMLDIAVDIAARHNISRHRANAEVERLRALCKQGYELSTRAASINWRGGKNQKEWLDDLRVLIEGYQDAYKASLQPAASEG